LLEKKCTQYSNSLLKDLSNLDAIAGPQEVRPPRKEQVQLVQTLMHDVNNISDKIHGALLQLKKCVDIKQSQLQNQTPQEENEGKGIGEKQPKRKKVEPTALSQEWRKMKLQPVFEVDESSTGYRVSTFIPGLTVYCHQTDRHGCRKT